jgi:hypothetical protein
VENARRKAQHVVVCNSVLICAPANSSGAHRDGLAELLPPPHQGVHRRVTVASSVNGLELSATAMKLRPLQRVKPIG